MQEQNLPTSKVVSIVRDNQATNHHYKGPPSGGGEPPMEARIARLESDVEYIKRDVGEIKTDLKEIKSEMKSDFKIHFGALIFVAIGLAGIMAKGFGWL